ncbi:sensor histidine kinase [Geofilum rhodophaeum]|uniref:sensor histidine kinase n=1 Tax=Geofilum rhodophaeum TaxID=1965019 RepID=UPI000B5222DF|nr:ATP-binding protein [Geofilum rhodophaeum]
MPKLSENTLFRHLRAFVNRHLGPSYLPGEGIDYWRERIFHYFSLATVFFGIALYLYYGLNFLLGGQVGFFIFLSAVFVLTLIALGLPALSIRFRIGWILFALYLTGSFLLLQGMHLMGGLLFLFASSVMAATMAGAIYGLLYLFLHSITLLAVGIYWYSGWIQTELLAPVSLKSFINLSVSFLVLNTITLAPLLSLLNGMIFSIDKEKRYRRILQKDQKDLLLASKRAEESDRLKTAFLSNMSHEIRTPMNAIMGFSTLLNNKQLEEREREEFTHLIQHNARNLMLLVEDIIDISKMETGQFKVQYAPCNLHQLLNGLRATAEEELFRMGRNNIEIKLNEGSNDKRLNILTDALRLRKILYNLMSNAIKFTEEGSVELGYRMESDQELVFYVKDTGIGLSDADAERIFHSFYKVQHEGEKLYGGTGIGLTIARHLVRFMGGEIWVDTQVSKGTSFYFSHPLQKVFLPHNPEELKTLVHELDDQEGRH